MLDENGGNDDGRKGKKVVDVTKIGAPERHLFIEKLIKHIEHDNLKLLHKIRKRTDKYDFVFVIHANCDLLCFWSYLFVKLIVNHFCV